ncbi:FAD-dependent oxidoreductase [Mangrovimicrobium sediminis]|uniref:FAD-dependent oxidoreductase n=1 Tax=Mangrovimicrobium sediminis TaxID=2562682 RepID=A0A4Z0M0X1_9GAMM|nr:FAD-dependent oxidoreductase [Haliea sp. SAOS-164]
MSGESRHDVVIVGAGIAGTALALALADSGLSIALVEARPLQRSALPDARDLESFDLRVSALTPASVGFLETLGAWDTIDTYRHCPYHHMTVWDAEGTGRIEFDRDEIDAPRLGSIVENRAIVDALLAALERNAGSVRPLSPVRVESIERESDGTQCLQLEDGATLRTALVVGADGALSRVRGLFDFATREWDYGHRGIVATVQTERPHADTAWQRFLASGPLALLPLPGTPQAHFCSIVWSITDALAEELLAMDSADFCAALGEASEHCLGEVTGVGQRAGFPLRQRHARDYVQPGVALVGDAAHTIHPLAGQGINLGLADVAALARELAAARERGEAPGDIAVLRRYQRQRKGENLAMMAAMEGFKRLFESESLPLRWLRNAGMRGVADIAPLKQRLMRHAMGIQ